MAEPQERQEREDRKRRDMLQAQMKVLRCKLKQLKARETSIVTQREKREKVNVHLQLWLDSNPNKKTMQQEIEYLSSLLVGIYADSDTFVNNYDKTQPQSKEITNKKNSDSETFEQELRVYKTAIIESSTNIQRSMLMLDQMTEKMETLFAFYNETREAVIDEKIVLKHIEIKQKVNLLYSIFLLYIPLNVISIYKT
eukprot:356632_1